MKIESIFSISNKMDCIRKGINYIINRPWTTMKVMAPWALMVAFFYVIFQWCVDTISMEVFMDGGMSNTDVFITFIIYALMCVANQLFLGRMFIFFRRTQAMVEREEANKLLNEGEETEAKQAVRLTLKERFMELTAISLCTLPYTFWIYLMGCPMLGIAEKTQQLIISQPSLTRQGAVSLAIIAIVVVVVFLALSLTYPLFHSAMTIKNKRDNHEPFNFKESLKIGFHHKGKIFTVTLLAYFIAILLSLIAYLPLTISKLAYSGSLISRVMQNDEVVIPSSGMWLMFFACLISMTIAVLFSLIIYTSQLYLYGSITTYENEKKNK